jgi:hypothetical protein
MDMPLDQCAVSDDYYYYDDDEYYNSYYDNSTYYYYGNSTEYMDDDYNMIEYMVQKCVTSNTPWNDGKEGLLVTEYEDDDTCTTDQVNAEYYYKYYLDVCIAFSNTNSLMYTSCAGNVIIK